MRVDFFDADDSIIHTYYGPDTVILGMVYPFDSFEIFMSEEEESPMVAKFLLGGDYYGHELTMTYGNYDCGQLGNFDNY
jgi:hypothetical protein